DPATRAGRAVAAHCRLLLQAAGDECVAIKPQVACFERLGAPGWSALRELVDTPYGHVAGLGADLLTASPLLGQDSIGALLSEARPVGGGLLLLTRTSN